MFIPHALPWVVPAAARSSMSVAAFSPGAPFSLVPPLPPSIEQLLESGDVSAMRIRRHESQPDQWLHKYHLIGDQMTYQWTGPWQLRCIAAGTGSLSVNVVEFSGKDYWCSFEGPDKQLQLVQMVSQTNHMLMRDKEFLQGQVKWAQAIALRDSQLSRQLTLLTLQQPSAVREAAAHAAAQAAAPSLPDARLTRSRKRRSVLFDDAGVEPRRRRGPAAGDTTS